MDETRQQALAFMRKRLPSVADHELILLENEVYEDATRNCYNNHIYCHNNVDVSNFQEVYRSAVREAVLGHRSPCQSPLPPDLESVVETKSFKSIPKCEVCNKNDCVTYKLVQRRSRDEGMTPEYECSRCNRHWN